MFSRISAIIERQIPDSLGLRGEELRKARLGLTISLITFAAGILYGPIFYIVFAAPVLTGLIFLASVQTLLSFPLLRITASARAVGHNLASMFFWLMTAMFYLTGGIDASSTFAWILLSPVTAVLLAGKNAGKFWTGAVIVSSTGILLLQWQNVVLPMLYDSSLRFPLIMVAFPGAVVIVYVFTSLLETSKDRALESAARAKANVQEALERSQMLTFEVEREKAAAEELARQSEAERSYLASNIEQMLVVIERFASGDLTVRISENTEGDLGRLARSLNSSVENFRTMVQTTFETLTATAESSNHIAEQSNLLNLGVHEQSTRVLQIASAMQQMSKTIEETSRFVSEAAREAADTGDEAQNGGEIIMATIDGMSDLARAVEHSANIIDELGKSSEHIGEVTRTIEEIADQTNLLALNAAIEAARAGDAGRGFAVVADEVRKLAERTQTATKEISTMLKKVQADTQIAVQSMHTGNRHVQASKEAASRAVETFRHIVSRTRVVADSISSAAAASIQQSATSAEIARNMDFIENFTKQTASGTAHIGDTTDELIKRMSLVQESVGRFRIGTSSVHTVRPLRKHETGGVKNGYIGNGTGLYAAHRTLLHGQPPLLPA